MAKLEVSLVPTPHGDARVHLARPADEPCGLMLRRQRRITTPDVGLASAVGLASGLAVALVEQPYRVAVDALRPRRFKLTPPGMPWPRTCRPTTSR